MNTQNKKIVPERLRPRTLARALTACAAAVLGLALPRLTSASENVPHLPYAQWADVPAPGQFVLGMIYEESEAYHIWAGGQSHDITVKSGGEKYGIDVNQGYLAFQYGINQKWAADLNIGVTTLAWRSFDANNQVRSTTGLMDWSFGVRYQVFNETNVAPAWLPTLTLRAGAVLPGTYNQHIAFAPGLRSAAIEPEVLARKHFGWPGLGGYADALYRWNRTTGNDQYITVIGLFQQIQRWELDAGYRHLQTLSGGDISYDPADPTSLVYPRDTREITDSIEAGFSYTTSRRHIRYAFNSRTTLDGSNSDNKFWVGGSIQIPFDTCFSK